jgi:proline racemase
VTTYYRYQLRRGTAAAWTSANPVLLQEFGLESDTGKLKVGDSFVHESIIGSLFKGRVKEVAKVGNYEAIVPSVEGWARITGYNTIFIDDRDPYKHGFQVI